MYFSHFFKFTSKNKYFGWDLREYKFVIIISTKMYVKILRNIGLKNCTQSRKNADILKITEITITTLSWRRFVLFFCFPTHIILQR